MKVRSRSLASGPGSDIVVGGFSGWIQVGGRRGETVGRFLGDFARLFEF